MSDRLQSRAPPITPLPLYVMPNLIVVGQTVRAYVRKTSEKLWPLRPASWDTDGHWSWHWWIGYLSLSINVQQIPWADFLLFPTIPVGIVQRRLGCVKLECNGATWSRKSETMFFDTIHDRDKQTDEQRLSNG